MTTEWSSPFPWGERANDSLGHTCEISLPLKDQGTLVASGLVTLFGCGVNGTPGGGHGSSPHLALCLALRLAVDSYSVLVVNHDLLSKLT